MATTAGRRSARVQTERSTMSMSDFEKEIFRLEAGSEAKNLLIYGDSNSGKTHLAGTLPGKTFWLVGEPGYKVAERLLEHPPHGRRIKDTATAWAAIEWLNHRNRYERYEWIVLDGGSTMDNRFRLAYAQEAFDIDPSKRQHRNLPDRPDYFNTQNFWKSWIPQLVDLPVNFLMTCHAYRTDKTENGELLVFPGIQGKVTETANAISGLMDITGYMLCRKMKSKNDPSKTKNVFRVYFDQPEGDDDIRYIVGDKIGTLPPYMNFPTMPQIISKLDGQEEEEK